MFGRKREPEPTPEPTQPAPMYRSLCCPACQLRKSEGGTLQLGQWTGALLCYGWELCAEHRARILALVRRSETDATLALDVLLWWFRFKDARRVPEEEF